MIIEVKKVSNGYILKDLTDYGDDVFKSEEMVIEEDEEYDNDTEALKNLLYEVAYRMGYINNKYSKNNLNIQFNEKGHKVDDE